MNNQVNQKAEQYFHHHLGIDLEALLAPIDEKQPTGRYLRANGVYSTIRDARKEDDSTLPMGTWEYELKRADWVKVTEVALHALANKTKDIQLVAWLLEAQLHKDGFRGIFACFVLMEKLCQKYWESLYPPIDGDLDYRLNILHWVNEKLHPLIKQIPITKTDRDGREYHWADWEQAKRNEQLKQNHSLITPADIEGAYMNEFMSAMAGTSTEHHRTYYEYLDNALIALDSLAKTLDEYCGEQAPSLNNLGGLLEEIQAIIASELYKRGVKVNKVHAADTDNDSNAGSDEGAGGGSGSAGGNGEGGGFNGMGAINGRADAYAQLAAAADYLIHIEPHSPAPYLVRRAIEWGNLNTSELYHELFVQYQGQISIFDLLGIELQQDGQG